MTKNPIPSTGRTVEFEIEGMTCASCVSRVERVIKKVPGVVHAVVNLATARATVTTADPSFPIQDIQAALKSGGYEVKTEQRQLEIAGMTCASCVSRVEKALKAVPGTMNATVNLATERATVTLVSGAGVEKLRQSLSDIGYEAREVLDDRAKTAERRASEAGRLRASLIVSAALTLPVFVLEMGSHALPSFHHWIMSAIGMETSTYIQFGLATMVLAGPGFRFLAKGFPNLFRRTPDMNSLVAIGTSAAWLYSVAATFMPRSLPTGTVHIYYEAATVVVTLILLGRYLEARSKGKTNAAVSRLLDLQAKTALTLRDGEYRSIPIDEVRMGDVIRVKPGQRLPVDGIVLEGASYIDESMITGEPLPVKKAGGDAVVGGTINKSGVFNFEATHVGSETVLAQIVKMVETAQGAKLPIQALVDKVTGWFVPVIILIAIVTFSIWYLFGPMPSLNFALVNAVAVLLVACPCAMGLATPTSIIVGSGRAAESGIFFRKGEALQTLTEIDTIAFDKTGTLTKGQPEMTDLVVLEAFSGEEVLRLVASLEALSEHPIGLAIVAAASERSLALHPVCDFISMAGSGIKGTTAGRQVHVGTIRSMNDAGIDTERFRERSTALGAIGKSPFYVAIDGELAAMIAVADPVKSTSAQAVAALRASGMRVVMITGDNKLTATAIARELNIDEVIAEVLPGGKVAALESLKSGDRKIAFVGDGINDAPALSFADVGVAIGSGTDVAIESADVVLMSGDLLGVERAISVGIATIKNIRQNLFWAFGYNACLIPVAAGILYPVNGTLLSPTIAAAAMALSSVFVIGNALRLRSFRVR